MRPEDCQPTPRQIQWLLDADPSIRWQVLRDLTDAPAETIAAERARVATEGWSAELLARQSPTGAWEGGQWDLVTLWSLAVLKDLGLDPASPQARKMIDRIDQHLVYKSLNNRPFFDGETEPCINGRILGLGAYFKEPNEALAQQLLDEQLPDGGWNCEASQRSSFHTTICVLEGLLAYQRAGRPSPAIAQARYRAEAYLLERHLFRSLRTGKVIDKRWLRFTYPTHWHYDVLRALDYFRQAYPREANSPSPDPRLEEAIGIVLKRRHQNNRWPLNLLHPEKIPLEMETRVASASRWMTLRALRVLRWYTGSW